MGTSDATIPYEAERAFFRAGGAKISDAAFWFHGEIDGVEFHADARGFIYGSPNQTGTLKPWAISAPHTPDLWRAWAKCAKEHLELTSV